MLNVSIYILRPSVEGFCGFGVGDLVLLQNSLDLFGTLSDVDVYRVWVGVLRDLTVCSR